MLPAILSENAVVQRGVDLPVGGSASPGERVRLTFRGHHVATVAGSEGRWRVRLGPFEAGGPDELVVETGGRAKTVRNVLVGDVWLCAGQSNMAQALRDTEGGEAEAARAEPSGVRLFTVPRRVAAAPCEEFNGGASWAICSPDSVSGFSAVGHYFGKHLHRELGVPIGLVQAAVGATPGESWVSMSVLESDEDYGPILERWRRSLADHPDPDGAYGRAFAQWDRQADLAEREGRPIPGAHPKLIGPGHPWTPAGLFNGMIAPLTSFPIRGVIWYQGAAAPDRAFQYRKLFRALIRDWRRAWRQGDFPFLFGQEAGFGPRRAEPTEHSWAELREAQAMALAEPNTAMAVAIDLGEEKNIHPLRKKPLGDRLALAARARVYGHDVCWSGPVFRAMTREGGRLRLCFHHACGGLRTSDGRPPLGFALSGGAVGFSSGNRGFVWAQAKIEGDEVLVWSDEAPHPVAVRYAWAQNPDCNLVNAAGLPAAPFRTDAWPGVTVSNR